MAGFDLVIADKVHRWAGKVASEYGTVLYDSAIPSKQRLFMTATLKVYTPHGRKRAEESGPSRCAKGACLSCMSTATEHPTPQPPRALQTLARLALASLAAEKCQDILHLASHSALHFAIGLNKSLIFMVLY